MDTQQDGLPITGFATAERALEFAALLDTERSEAFTYHVIERPPSASYAIEYRSPCGKTMGYL